MGKPKKGLTARRKAQQLARTLSSGLETNVELDALLPTVRELSRLLGISHEQLDQSLYDARQDSRKKVTGVDGVKIATIRMRMADEKAFSTEIGRAVNAFNGLVTGSVLASVIHSGVESQNSMKVWEILMNSPMRESVFGQLLGSFGSAELRRVRAESEYGSAPAAASFEDDTQRHILLSAPFVIESADPELFDEMFSFAFISRMQRRSPLALTAAVVFSGALPPTLVYLCLRAIAAHRRDAAEVRIREAEADIRESDAALARLRVRVAEELTREIESAGLQVSKELAQELLRQASPAIADLGNKALIGNISVGLPKFS
jgi:hypothetical protein